MNCFVTALEDGAVQVQRCCACGLRQAPAGHACRACGQTALEWVELEETGRVYAITTVHRAPDADFVDLVPFDVAIVDFGDGLRLMGHVAEGLSIGETVCARPRQIAGRALLYFIPNNQTDIKLRNHDA